ncbi:hypothetical protein P0Y35_13325 [Kiritimatiellaeota bacterium B1221]|nr:hypothetical protein [Kiritimatiellaeota bacterium B1221]
MSKSRRSPTPQPVLPLLTRVFMGSAVGLLYLWCMLIPLVGKAGSQSPQSRENFITVLAVLVSAFLFTSLACRQLRKHPAPSPWYLRVGYSLCLLQLVCLFLLLGGAFAV